MTDVKWEVGEPVEVEDKQGNWLEGEIVKVKRGRGSRCQIEAEGGQKFWIGLRQQQRLRPRMSVENIPARASQPKYALGSIFVGQNINSGLNYEDAIRHLTTTGSQKQVAEEQKPEEQEEEFEPPQTISPTEIGSRGSILVENQ